MNASHRVDDLDEVIRKLNAALQLSPNDDQVGDCMRDSVALLLKARHRINELIGILARALKLADSERVEKECDPELERRAAEMWRADNPNQSVFDCDEETKIRYRRKALMEMLKAP